jgi:hypothetical protein
MNENICPDCITAHRVVAEMGLTPFRNPPTEGVYPVVDRERRPIKVCWVHTILYPNGVRYPDPGVVLREALGR